MLYLYKSRGPDTQHCFNSFNISFGCSKEQSHWVGSLNPHNICFRYNSYLWTWKTDVIHNKYLWKNSEFVDFEKLCSIHAKHTLLLQTLQISEFILLPFHVTVNISIMTSKTNCQKTSCVIVIATLIVTIFILGSANICKQVLWQTMKTQLKCHLMQHFIRVCKANKAQLLPQSDT